MIGEGEVSISLRVYNPRARDLAFYLAPWGEQYVLPCGHAFDITARGPNQALLELEYGDDCIILYGWPGSVVTVHHRQTELGVGESARTPVPHTPAFRNEQETMSGQQDQHLPNGEDGEAKAEPEHDGSVHVGGQAHQDMGPEGQQSAFGRPMSAGEGDDVHDVDNLV